MLLKEIILTFALININVDTTGLLIPYTIGALGYIKKNLNICEYRLIGISGGSFASVIYHLEDDISNHDKLWNKLLGDDNYVIKADKNMEEFQQIIKYNILNNYKNVNINNIPISIIVTNIDDFKITNRKIDKFSNLEELLDYCICSSYIPYICGNTFSKKYKDLNFIDGGIFKNLHHFDCINNEYSKCERSIYIHTKMANRKFDFRNYIYINKTTSKKLFDYGWNDCKNIFKDFHK